MDIGGQEQEKQQPAQQVFTFSHPGHRFGPQRVDGEDRGHEGAHPQLPRQLPQDQQQQACRGGVQGDVGEMMPAGPQLIDLAVEHVRDPGQRMPVRAVEMREGPAHARPGKPCANRGIVVDVHIVINIHPVEGDRLAEDQEYAEHRQETCGRQRRVGRSPAGEGRTSVLELRALLFLAIMILGAYRLSRRRGHAGFAARIPL